MAFLGVEFEERIGGGIAIVSREWVTPRKREVFWPPYKNQEKYNKAVKAHEIPKEDTWELFRITRLFFEVDDYESACKKIKIAEDTSDIQTDAELSRLAHSKRKRSRPSRFSVTDESDVDDDCDLARPPPIKYVIGNSSHSSIRTSKQTSYTDVVQSPSTPRTSSPAEHHYLSKTNAAERTAVQSIASTSSTGQGVFEQNILKLLGHVKEQNNQILSWIQKQSAVPTSILPENLPVALPLNTIEDLETLEIYLHQKEKFSGLSAYLSTLGGKDASSVTNYVMKRCLSNALATKFSFCGKRLEKKAFSQLNLKVVIICF